jgi:phosphatidate cytidylyltransferase
MMWLVLVVVVTDVVGYFAGRAIGGPKFWPRVSPKKTWSGTVAGWAVAVAVALLFMPLLAAGPGLIVASVLIAMAGQAGDIAQSAIKRHAGVKDSSNLIPGHGGVMDRFDALVAAALVELVLAQTGFLGG